MNMTGVDNRSYDPLILSIGKEWLTQYARFLRRSPELVERLADRPDEFEMMPIPKSLLNRLAVPGVIGTGFLGDLDAGLLELMNCDFNDINQELSTSYTDTALNTIHEFTEAITNGDSARIVSLFSPDFTNPDGKNAAEVGESITHLFDKAYVRHFRVLDIEQIHSSAIEVVARVHATWHAAGGKEFTDSAAETVFLELVLERQLANDWKISAVRSV